MTKRTDIDVVERDPDIDRCSRGEWQDWGRKDCEICGEHIRLDEFGDYAEEVGEFVENDEQVLEPRHVFAHVQCGLDRHYPIA